MKPSDYPVPPICQVLDTAIDWIFWPAFILICLAILWAFYALVKSIAGPDPETP